MEEEEDERLLNNQKEKELKRKGWLADHDDDAAAVDFREIKWPFVGSFVRSFFSSLQTCVMRRPATLILPRPPIS